MSAFLSVEQKIANEVLRLPVRCQSNPYEKLLQSQETESEEAKGGSEGDVIVLLKARGFALQTVWV